VALGAAVALVAWLAMDLEAGNRDARSAAEVSAAQARSRHSAVPPGGRGIAVRRAARGAGNTTIRRLLRLGLPIYCAGPHGHEVALTFDDGPGPYTGLAVRKLARARERATFFVVGNSMDRYRGYLPRELKVGAIGDHTYTHPALIALSPRQVTWQLKATAQKIVVQSGKHVELFRPPYELHNATVDRIAQRLGLLEILWDVDSQDSLGADHAQIVRNVEAGLRPGAIIEMHENHGQTIRALTTLLPELRRRHLRSVSVPELLASDPPSQAQVRKGYNGCSPAERGLRHSPRHGRARHRRSRHRRARRRGHIR
jgi:peptidoglycan/xylan/chitin deacetylase (PgdA/CDA1 family)